MALHQLLEWADHDVEVAVNLSVHNLMDLNFADSSPPRWPVTACPPTG